MSEWDIARSLTFNLNKERMTHLVRIGQRALIFNLNKEKIIHLIGEGHWALVFSLNEERTIPFSDMMGH